MVTQVETPWMKWNEKEAECVGGKYVNPGDKIYGWWSLTVCRSGLEKHGFEVGSERFKMIFSSVEVKGAVKSRWSPTPDAMEELGEKIGLKCHVMQEPTEGQKAAGRTELQRVHIIHHQRKFVWWWVEVDA